MGADGESDPQAAMGADGVSDPQAPPADSDGLGQPADSDGSGQQPEGGVGYSMKRAGTLERMARAGSTLGLGSMTRASTLPTEEEDLFHAVRHPLHNDLDEDRICWGGMWKPKQVLGFILGSACLLVLSFWHPIQEYPYANPMLGITFLCGSFWVFEVIPLYITGLMPLIFMPLYEISSSDQAAKAYWNQVQLLIISTYLVDLALEQVQLPRRVALAFLVSVGVLNPAMLLLCFMLLCYILSTFCNSIAVTLMITPFAIGLMNAAEEQARNMDGESTGSDSDSDGSSAPRAVDGNLKAVQRCADGMLLGIAYASTCGGITSLTGAIPNEVMSGISGVQDQIHYRNWMLFAFPASFAALVICYVGIWFRYMRRLEVRAMTQEILEVEMEEFRREWGETMSRDEIIVLILQIVQFGLLFLRPILSEYVTTKYGEELLGDATLACIPAILLFLCPSERRPGQSLLTWPHVHKKFDFGLILLVGGAYAIADGFKQSGLNIALGNGIAGITRNQDSFMLTFTVVLMCTIFTQVFSAVGTAGTMLPALNAAAQNCLKSPLSMLLPATVACSFAFMLPTAAPGNIVVLAKSQDLPRELRVRDFFLTGVPITLAVLFVGTFFIHVMQDAVFDVNQPFPQWACDGVSCVWVNVAGIVSGASVTSQACVPDTQMELCTLSNGTVINLGAFLPPLPLPST